MKFNVPPLILFVVFFLFSLGSVSAQDEIISNAKVAIKTGNSKELIKHFHNTVELKISANESDGVMSNNYSKTQAEYVLKGFFKDNPPQDFVYVHQGTSKEGMKYTIGKYTYRDSTGKAVGTFRVFMKLKMYEGSYLIDEIDFSKE
ncbi:DUF4783 domain-containing protein [Thermoflexibacter ruber]|uniref:DUF4783 domain-containing protein n=1 Tax=Thermoflexibacter ruber TaxID=1003 RepID=A0A1I2CQN1_9BACT|nr:DUF4783 domain-containing protein [Thermoflexibacter ruber]SFE70657.1 protein of unknown function [Thermoflexibacter ruber]